MLVSAPGSSSRAQSNADLWFRPERFAILLSIFIIAAFPDVVFGLRTFFYRDFGIFGYPLAYYHRESFWRGEVPLWNPLNDCGVPFLAQWNAMTFYPFSLFYLLFPLSWSLGVFCLLHLLLGGLGMYWLSHRWTGDWPAACLAGIAFAFNGLTLSCLKWPNNISALGWMPWVICLAEAAMLGTSRRLLVAASLAGAMQMFTGGPEIILFTWLIVLALAVIHFFRSSAPRAMLARNTILLGLLVAGLTAVQIFPFLDLLRHSQRGAGYSDASWSMPASGWANLLLPLFRCFPSYHGVFAQPGQYWISSYYPGVGIVLLALLAGFCARGPRMPLLMACVGLGLILALGPAGYIYTVLRKWVPLLEIVRYPIKFVVPAIFALPSLAAFSLAQLRFSIVRSNTPLRVPMVVIGILLLGLMALLLFVIPAGQTPAAPHVPPQVLLQNGLTRCVFLLILGVLLFAWSKQSSRSWLLGYALLTVLWLDFLTQAPRLNPTIERWVYEPGLARKELKLTPLPELGKSRIMVTPYADFRLNHLSLTNAADDFLYSRMASFANCNLLDGFPKTDSFLSLYTRDESRVRSLLYASTNASFPGLMNYLGVSHINASEKPIDWLPRNGAAPLVTGGQMPVFTDSASALAELRRPGFDPLRVLYLPPEARGHGPSNNAPLHLNAQIRRVTAHRLDIEVEASEASWLTVAQSYYHPWHAIVNGSSTSIWPANVGFQALAVPAGKSTVTLVYRDAAFRIGAFLGVVTLGFCLWLWFREQQQPDLTASTGTDPDLSS